MRRATLATDVQRSGSVFPTVGSVNPSLTIQAIACRTVDRIVELAACGELQDIAVRVCRPLTQECPLLNR
jgi:hypothetical protein